MTFVSRRFWDGPIFACGGWNPPRLVGLLVAIAREGLVRNSTGTPEGTEYYWYS